MPIRVDIKAGVLYDLLKSSIFSDSIIDTVIEVKETHVETISISVAKDRLAFCKSPIVAPGDIGKWGIVDTPGVARMINNFKRSDILSVYQKENGKIRVERSSPFKFYEFDSVPLDELICTAKLNVTIGKSDELLIKNLKDGSTMERGKFEAFFEVSPKDLKDVFKENDSFTQDVFISIADENTLRISSYEDEDESGDSVPIKNLRMTSESVLSGYADLSEVVKNLRAKSTVKVAFGNNNMIIIQEIISKEKGNVEVVQYTIMPKVKEER